MGFFLMLLYNILYTLALPFVIIYVVFVRRRSFSYALDRFGRSVKNVSAIEKGKKRIWIHAVSLGESRIALRLAQVLSQDGVDVVISSSTPSGMEFVSKNWDENRVFFCPWDLVWLIKRVIKRISPFALILIETELWPSLIVTAAKCNLRVFLANARLSDKSLRGYRRISFLIRRWFDPCITMVLCRSNEDVGNFVRVGFSAGKVKLLGNLKYSLLPTQIELPILDVLRKRKKICVLGSIHLGEEMILFESWDREDMKDWFIVLCPRHIEKKYDVRKNLMQMKFRVRFLSELNDWEEDIDEFDVLVVDRYGVLSGIYKWADVVFVGGSLLPKGGQNIIEPAWWTVPICFGEYMDNFRDVAEFFLQKKAAKQIGGSADFIRFCHMAAEGRLKEMAKRAREISREYAGIVNRYKEVILEYVTLDKCD